MPPWLTRALDAAVPFIFGVLGGVTFLAMVFFGHSKEGATALRAAILEMAQWKIETPFSYVLITAFCLVMAGVASYIYKLPRTLVALAAGFAMAGTIITGSAVRSPFKELAPSVPPTPAAGAGVQSNLHRLEMLAGGDGQQRQLIFQISHDGPTAAVRAELNLRLYESDKQRVESFSRPRLVEITGPTSTFCVDISMVDFRRPPIVYEISLSSEGYAPIWLVGELRAHELPWQLSLQLEQGGRKLYRDFFGTNIQRQPNASIPADCKPLAPPTGKSA